MDLTSLTDISAYFRHNVKEYDAFVATCFKRGINWLFYPMILLAMCDSCIGGKTGLNNRAKNQVALFSAPAKVILKIAYSF